MRREADNAYALWRKWQLQDLTSEELDVWDLVDRERKRDLRGECDMAVAFVAGYLAAQRAAARKKRSKK